LAHYIEFVHGKLRIGEPSVPPLIKAVKSHINGEKTVIIDSPPGTSCSVIESIKNSDICLLVTEPTPFGLYDLKLAVDLVRKLKIPFRVIINKCNLGDIEVYRFCETEKIEIVMEIPIDKRIAKSYSNGILIVKEFSEYKMKFQELMKKILNN
jgi:MinD superfamily P-loop ATPase